MNNFFDIHTSRPGRAFSEQQSRPRALMVRRQPSAGVRRSGKHSSTGEELLLASDPYYTATAPDTSPGKAHLGG